MDAVAGVLERWLPVDPQIRHKADRLQPGQILNFAVMRGLNRIELRMSYEEVQFVKAKLVLKGVLR